MEVLDIKETQRKFASLQSYVFASQWMFCIFHKVLSTGNSVLDVESC